MLAHSLRDEPTVSAAFAAFQRTRRPRAEQVVAYAQQISKRKTISRNPLAVLARDMMLPIFLRKAVDRGRVRPGHPARGLADLGLDRRVGVGRRTRRHLQPR